MYSSRPGGGLLVSWINQDLSRGSSQLTVAADVELLPVWHRGVHVDETRPRLWRVVRWRWNGSVERDWRGVASLLRTLACQAYKGGAGRFRIAEQVEGVVGGVEGVESAGGTIRGESHEC